MARQPTPLILDDDDEDDRRRHRDREAKDRSRDGFEMGLASSIIGAVFLVVGTLAPLLLMTLMRGRYNGSGYGGGAETLLDVVSFFSLAGAELMCLIGLILGRKGVRLRLCRSNYNCVACCRRASEYSSAIPLAVSRNIRGRGKSVAEGSEGFTHTRHHFPLDSSVALPVVHRSWLQKWMCRRPTHSHLLLRQPQRCAYRCRHRLPTGARGVYSLNQFPQRTDAVRAFRQKALTAKTRPNGHA